MKFKRHKQSVQRPKPLKACRHRGRIDPVTSDHVCIKCHEIFDITMINKDVSKVKNLDILIWNREYDKSRWIWDGLEYLNGDHNDVFNCMMWKELLEEIPNPCTWYQIYQIFHKYRITDYWTCFPSYVGLAPSLNPTIVYHLFKYSHLGYTKYRISYLYLLYKFTQMFGSKEEAQKIPIKGSKPWIQKTDAWWKTICEEHAWSFIPSETVKLKWNKNFIVEALEEYLQKSIEKI